MRQCSWAHWCAFCLGWGVFSALLAACATCAIVRGSHPCDLSSANPPRNEGGAYPLTIGPDPISLGKLGYGQLAKATASVRNRGPEPVTVVRIETSCPCLRAVLEPTTVGPREAGRMSLSFDPRGEHDFRGDLSIEVVGYKGGREVAFRACARVSVP
ncbi:MAG: DUF1573 domain-containing protein [Isosphaeraceae bacterium]